MLWSDYLCPWCYLGRDRNRLLAELGVTITHLPFDLHPDVPQGGRRVPPGGRLARVLGHIAEECAQLGIPFTIPDRLPNTGLALRAAEVVRRHWPSAFAAFDDALFAAVFVDGADLADPEVVTARADTALVPVEDMHRVLAEGAGERYLEEAMGRAREAGVAATPAWQFDSGLIIPGVQPREVLTRWVGRMQERARPRS